MKAMRTVCEDVVYRNMYITGPRRHRHRYYGVLAPNAPLRAPVTALGSVPESRTAPLPTATETETEPIAATAAPITAPGASSDSEEEAEGAEEALLLARIYEVFPLVCPCCGSEMRIIAFISVAAAVRHILTHIGEPTSPPRLMPARAPPLWEMQGVPLGEDEAPPQAVPEYEFDQRIAW